MFQKLSAWILKVAGWKLDVSLPDYPKCIICVAPHTSNWDFILGKLAYSALGRKAGFLMKESWFFFPLGYFFKAIGGVPVPRKRRGGSLVKAMVNRFNESERLTVAITPEGTRSRVSRWHTGFLNIAYEAHVPVALAVIDFRTKTITLNDTLALTGDAEADIATVKRYYHNATGKHPEKFTTD